jgi:maleate isomerase
MTGDAGPALRLGVLTPSSNTVLEPQTLRLVRPLGNRLSVHFARFQVTAISDDPGSREQFSEAALLEAARLLADARVDAILWAGTSGAWVGLDADHALVAAIRSSVGVPSTTSTLALLDALGDLAARRYGLVVPYVESIVDAIERTLAAEGYACIARSFDSMTVNWDFAGIPATTVSTRVREVARAQPDAIVIHCTNLRGAEVAEQLETELQIPVLDSVVVGLWGSLRSLGLEVPQAGFGRLANLHPPRRLHDA